MVIPNSYSSSVQFVLLSSNQKRLILLSALLKWLCVWFYGPYELVGVPLSVCATFLMLEMVAIDIPYFLE